MWVQGGAVTLHPRVGRGRERLMQGRGRQPWSTHMWIEGAVGAGPGEAALVHREALLEDERRPRHEEAVNT